MKRENNFAIISISTTVLLIILLIIFFIVKSVNNSNTDKFAEEMSSFEKSESASTKIGKNVEEAEEEKFEEAEKLENETNESTTTIKETNENKDLNKTLTNDNKNKTINTSTKVENKDDKNQVVETNAKQTKNDKIELEAPVKGEIIREFAKDSLVFSNTLQEWTTHNGVDIKADKTSVVKSAADGTVSAIKNDPRYGLTVIINHDNGYQTIYSNLLTAEFVVKGEKVEKGQSIGTVGNTASFEILDDSHLHFEVLKNNEYLDPTIYISFE